MAFPEQNIRSYPNPLQREEVLDYILRGTPCGDFLEAVFCDQLVTAFTRADELNSRSMREIAAWMYSHCPIDCRGSKEVYQTWVERGGLRGLTRSFEGDKDV